MKQKTPPISRESILPDNDLIISKTDAKGLLVYVNDVLVNISGFAENELLGKQHNIVRHPDMPRSVFKLLWDTIKSGEEFNGYVKNLCKDGGFYWVFANVTPSYDVDGKLLGYYSVRRKPRKEALNIIQPLYAQMISVEQEAGSKNSISLSATILERVVAEKGASYDEFVCTI